MTYLVFNYMYMSVRKERLIEQKSQQAKYKLIECNSSGTYERISLFDKDKNVVSTPIEIYYGVALDNIDSIDKTIDVTQNIIRRV